MKLVQLGDSYSAGNGAGDYYGPKDCYRSTTSYARRWVKTLTAGHNVTFVNRACSGGVLDNLDHRRLMDETDVTAFTLDDVDVGDLGARQAISSSGRCASPYRDDESYEFSVYAAIPQLGGTTVYAKCRRYMNPQWDAVDKSTDLVVLTIGGNDLSFADIVQQCFVVGYRDPHDCKDHVDQANRDLEGLGARIEAFMRRLKGRMRDDAKILLLSYPFLEKDEDLTLGRSVLGVGTVYDVGHGVRELGRSGDKAQRGAINAVNGEPGARVVYLDGIKDLFAGHEPDGRATHKNPDRWLNEPTDSWTRYEWYHFNPKGHEEIGKLLSGYGDFAAGHQTATRAAGIDVVFAIDTTGSMGNSIDAVKQTASNLVNDISAQTSSARFALIDYRDFAERTGDSGDYPAKLDTDFTMETGQISSAINDLSLGYGGDGPETMFSALHMAYGLTWRPGVKKLVVVLSDAPPLSPEPISGLTIDQITNESLAIDPAEVHLVDVGSAGTSEMQDLASQTNGGVYDSSSSDAAQQIADVVDHSLDQPYAWAAGPYVGKIGASVTLDGSGSYGVGSDIVKWEWDVDGDGTYDVRSNQPTAQHAYTSAIDGLVSLRVTDVDGRTGLATAPVRMTDDGDEVPRGDDNCPDVANPGQEDEDGDGVGNSCDASPGFPTADKDGVFVGTRAASPSGGPAPSTGTAGSGTPVKPAVRKLALKVSAIRLTRGGRRLEAKLRCTAVIQCRGRVTFAVAGRKLRISYKIKPGRSAVVHVAVPAGVRRALA
ncbi:MAG: VWA domain-containing protein, partial [Baekduia sp.]